MMRNQILQYLPDEFMATPASESGYTGEEKGSSRLPAKKRGWDVIDARAQFLSLLQTGTTFHSYVRGASESRQ